MARVKQGEARKDSSFKQFVLDQLLDLRGVTCRAMFGGYGLYQHSVFFGIIHTSRLYFKTNERTKEHYVQEGMKPFRPNRSQTLKNYYEVPANVLDEPERLLAWAQEAAAYGVKPQT